VWFTVLRAGVPVGAVELPMRELTVGRLVRLGGYAAIAARVRVASQALLAHGLYGPPVSTVPDLERRRARAALRAGATLALELRALPTGELVPTTFVSLVEAPADGETLVVACFRTLPVIVPAVEQRTSRMDRGGTS